MPGPLPKLGRLTTKPLSNCQMASTVPTFATSAQKPVSTSPRLMPSIVGLLGLLCPVICRQLCIWCHTVSVRYTHAPHPTLSLSTHCSPFSIPCHFVPPSHPPFAVMAGMFAIRAERDFVLDDDFMKGVRKVMEGKKLEGKLEYKKV